MHIDCIKAVKQYRRENDATLDETPLEELYWPVKEAYASFVDDLKFDVNEFEVDEIIRRHRLARWKAYRAEQCESEG